MYAYLRTYTEDVSEQSAEKKFKSNRGTRRREDYTMQNFIVDILTKNSTVSKSRTVRRTEQVA
jgi:hypothetical protein